MAAANDEAVPAHVLTAVPVRALRLPRRGRLPEPGALRHALRVRRARREEMSDGQAAAPTPWSSSARPATWRTRRSSPPCRAGPARQAGLAGGRRREIGLDARAARGARARASVDRARRWRRRGRRSSCWPSASGTWTAGSTTTKTLRNRSASLHQHSITRCPANLIVDFVLLHKL